jgi:hypothetical protein
MLDETPEAARFYLGAHQLEFFSSDTGGYRDNLRSGRPSLWVALAPVDADPGIALQTVTGDPAEGRRSPSRAPTRSKQFPCRRRSRRG